jgi:cystathionine beta-lyase/cystathionine gamma-synthase
MGLGYSNTTVDHQGSLPGDNPLIGEEIVRLMRPNTRVVYFESAGSPTFEVQDVPAIAAAAHEAGAKVLMDNTWASPYLFRSFDRLTYGKPGLKNDGFLARGRRT